MRLSHGPPWTNDTTRCWHCNRANERYGSNNAAQTHVLHNAICRYFELDGTSSFTFRLTGGTANTYAHIALDCYNHRVLVRQPLLKQRQLGRMAR
jgi:hypothetical protein